jgi:hypothetical protein
MKFHRLSSASKNKILNSIKVALYQLGANRMTLLDLIESNTHAYDAASDRGLSRNGQIAPIAILWVTSSSSSAPNLFLSPRNKLHFESQPNAKTGLSDELYLTKQADSAGSNVRSISRRHQLLLLLMAGKS